MKFKQNYWHFLPIIDMIETYKLDSPTEFVEHPLQVARPIHY